MLYAIIGIILGIVVAVSWNSHDRHSAQETLRKYYRKDK